MKIENLLGMVNKTIWFVFLNVYNIKKYFIHILVAVLILVINDNTETTYIMLQGGKSWRTTLFLPESKES